MYRIPPEVSVSEKNLDRKGKNAQKRNESYVASAFATTEEAHPAQGVISLAPLDADPSSLAVSSESTGSRPKLAVACVELDAGLVEFEFEADDSP